jgi:hypothetical protein
MEDEEHKVYGHGDKEHEVYGQEIPINGEDVDMSCTKDEAAKVPPPWPSLTAAAASSSPKP